MEIKETLMTLQRVLPPGMQPADGKAGIGISFAPDMEGYQIIQSMAPQGSAAASGQVGIVIVCECPSYCTGHNHCLRVLHSKPCVLAMRALVSASELLPFLCQFLREFLCERILI